MTKASALHPKHTSTLRDHEQAEQLFLKAYRVNRLHHAWLIGGVKGIGKATLAWRIARFILAFPNPSIGSPSSLFLSPDHHIFLKCAADAHPDMVVLEPTNQNPLIPLETLRTQLSRLQMTTSGTGFRVCLIDSIDNLTMAGMNALLKILEEPPPQTLFLLITHRPHKVLPTIRSRCWRLNMQPSSPAAEPLHTPSPHAKDSKREVELLHSLRNLICTPQALPQDQYFQTVSRLSLKDFSLGTLGNALETWIMEGLRSEILSYPETMPPKALAKLEHRVELWQKTQEALRQTCALHGDPRPLLLQFFEAWRSLFQTASA